MRAHEIMSRQVITVGVEASVADAITTMLAHHVSGLPVVDSAGRLVGIVSEGDFIRRAEIGTGRKRGRWLTFLAGADRAALDFAREHGRKVGEIMTTNPVTIGEDAPLPEIVDIMEAHGIKRLPVMRDGKIVGMVTRADFLPAIVDLARRVKDSSKDDDQIRGSVIAAMEHATWRPCALKVAVIGGVVSLRGVVRSDKARQAAIVAAENVPGVKKVEDLICEVAYPPPEEDYGGGDFVSLQAETSTEDDQPL
jgi:CBS domain-containing protein